MARAYDAAEQAFGTVTILVNNAGVAHAPARAVEVSAEEWRKVLGDRSSTRCSIWAQEAARRMLAAKKQGAIVNIASVLGLAVAKGAAAYAAAKAGVIQITKALALELAFKGVRVNAIAPGWFVTEINDKYLDERGRRRHQARDPDGPLRQGRATSTARCCCWCPTPAATSPAPPLWSTAGRWCRSRGRGPMDFTLPPEIEDIRVRTRAFVAEHVLPLEADPANFDRSRKHSSRMRWPKPVQAKAKAAGLWAPQAPKDYGGRGLPVIGWAAMYEEANRSIFGPWR